MIMILRTKGKALNINEIIVSKITRFPHKLNHGNYILISDKDELFSDSYATLTRNSDLKNLNKEKLVYGIKDLNHLNDSNKFKEFSND